MKKYLLSTLLVLFALVSCSDSNNEHQPDDKNDSAILKSILYNGEELAEDSELEVDSQTKSHFVVEVDNLEPSQIVWLLNDEVVGEGSVELTLEGRSGELFIGSKNLNSAKQSQTRALVGSFTKLKKVAQLSGAYKQGTFAFTTSMSTGTGMANNIVFINDKLIAPASSDVLFENNPSREDELTLSGSYSDLNVFKNRLFIAQTYFSGDNSSSHNRLIEADAQTLKILAIHEMPEFTISKLVMLDQTTVLAWSHFNDRFIKGDLLTGDWDTNYSVFDNSEELLISEILNTRFLRSDGNIAFAYGSRLVVLNSEGKLAKEVEMGENCRIVALLRGGNQKNEIKLVVDAKQVDSESLFSDYVDTERYPARLVTLDSSFNVVSEVEHKLKHTKNGAVVLEKSGIRSYYAEANYGNQGLAITNSQTKNEFYYLRNNELSIDVYRLDETGVSELAFTIDPQPVLANVSSQPCTDLSNYMYVPVKSTGMNEVHIIDLNNKGKYIDHITFDDYYPVAVFPVGSHLE